MTDSPDSENHRVSALEGDVGWVDEVVALAKSGDSVAAVTLLRSRIDALPASRGEEDKLLAMVLRTWRWLVDHGETVSAATLLDYVVAHGQVFEESDIRLRTSVASAYAELLASTGRASAAQRLTVFVDHSAPSGLHEAQQVVADGFRRIAAAAEQRGDVGEALEALEAVSKRYGGEDSSELRWRVVETTVQRARLCIEAEDEDRAVDLLEGVVAEYLRDKAKPVVAQVSAARQALGGPRLSRGENVLALETFSALSADLKRRESDLARTQLATALYGRARALIELDRAVEAATLADRLASLARLGSDARMAAVRALAWLWTRLQEAAAWEEAVIVLDTGLALLVESRDEFERGLAGLALVDKANDLRELGREAEAALVRRSAVDGFAPNILATVDRVVDDLHPTSRGEDVARAARALYVKAELLEECGDPLGRAAALSELRDLLPRLKTEGTYIEAAVRRKWPDQFSD